ncbi:PAS domain S-box-containing protein/diguanylate cyclase (GGDEF)-like protein [Sporomusa sp. KB1]|nr:PAS domain S-box-containing protein/diguanylate cyclase (GGDEF)-like protein [Sporomusa sp. KB1]
MKLSFYKALLDNLYDGVYFVDNDRKIIYWNHSAEKVTGYSSNDIVGCHCYGNILNHTDGEGCLLCSGGCPLAKTIKDGCLREAEVYLQHKLGYRIPVSVRISPVRNASDEIIGAVEIFSDNSQKVQLVEQLEQFKELALLDSLTGLGNKRYAEFELSNKMSEVQKIGRPIFGVLFADIDHFKKVNDQYGHDVGDKVLEMVAKTIQNGIIKEGIAFRWGGEEFLAVINTYHKEELVKVAERVRALTEQTVFRSDSNEIRVTISVGATLVEMNDTDEALVKRADKLLYLSKQNGRNKVTSLFDKGLLPGLVGVKSSDER